LYIKLETGYNNKMKVCGICKKPLDPKCTWIPCQLEKEINRAKKENK